MVIDMKHLPDYCYSKTRMREVKGAVIHYISAEYVDGANRFNLQTVINFLKDANRNPADREFYKNHPEMKKITSRLFASYHYLVPRDPSLAINLVPFPQRAYHAGSSQMHGINDCNAFCIGIGLIASHRSGFTDFQYEQAARLCHHHNIPLMYIKGHSDVATPAGRKVDPGPTWDWKKFEQIFRRQGDISTGASPVV